MMRTLYLNGRYSKIKIFPDPKKETFWQPGGGRELILRNICVPGRGESQPKNEESSPST